MLDICRATRRHHYSPTPRWIVVLVYTTQVQQIASAKNAISVAINRKMIEFQSSARRPKGLRVNSPWGEAEWAIDPWPLRAKGLIVLVSPN